jgi:hypothetical protein
MPYDLAPETASLKQMNLLVSTQEGKDFEAQAPVSVS